MCNNEHVIQHFDNLFSCYCYNKALLIQMDYINDMNMFEFISIETYSLNKNTYTKLLHNKISIFVQAWGTLVCY